MKASCKHLTHEYASFNGCTVVEAFMMGGIYIVLFIFFDICFAFVLRECPYIDGFMTAFILLAVSNVLFIPLAVKLTTRKIGRMRKGRPAGFIRLKGSQILHTRFGISIPYVTRNGVWTTRRSA